jgi:2-polyprenyl-6-methoxyphenol hydroxylase-like FAD-dependent oxidoreductase
MTKPLRIGILGSGPAGKTLATGFLANGHPVMIGSRNPAKLRDWLREADPKPRIDTLAATAQFGELIDMGGIESARWLEALSLAWVVYSHRTGKTRMTGRPTSN